MKTMLLVLGALVLAAGIAAAARAADDKNTTAGTGAEDATKAADTQGKPTPCVPEAHRKSRQLSR